MSENTWVTEEDFDSMKLVNDYKKTISGTRELRSSRKKLIKLNYVLTLIVLINLVIRCIGFEIKSTFKYCDNGNFHNLIDYENLCPDKLKGGLVPASGSQRILDYYYKENRHLEGSSNTDLTMYVLGHSKYFYYGEGYVCNRKKVTLKTSMSFFGDKFEKLTTEVMELSGKSVGL